MAENLRTTRYKEGSAIPQVTNNTAWLNTNFGAWSWYNNANSYEQPYGKLYNGHAVTDPRNLCPTGWHVPINSEWTTLTNFLGGGNVDGGPMKEAGTTHWLSPNTGSTNSSGFSGLPGGCLYPGGSFGLINENSFWWTSTVTVTNMTWYYLLNYNNSDAASSSIANAYGFSVRCVKN